MKKKLEDYNYHTYFEGFFSIVTLQYPTRVHLEFFAEVLPVFLMSISAISLNDHISFVEFHSYSNFDADLKWN